MDLINPLWTPRAEQDSALETFLNDVNSHFGLQLSNYHELWRWSVDDIEQFWAYWWQQANLIVSHQPTDTLRKSKLIRKTCVVPWRPSLILLRIFFVLEMKASPLFFVAKAVSRETLSYKSLYEQTASVANEFQRLGVQEG